jgi:transposase
MKKAILRTPKRTKSNSFSDADRFGTFKALFAQKVYKCVKMFLETGSVLRKKGSGRLTKRTAENIEEVEQRIAETPNKSIWRLIQETNISFGTP